MNGSTRASSAPCSTCASARRPGAQGAAEGVPDRRVGALLEEEGRAARAHRARAQRLRRLAGLRLSDGEPRIPRDGRAAPRRHPRAHHRARRRAGARRASTRVEIALALGTSTTSCAPPRPQAAERDARPRRSSPADRPRPRALSNHDINAQVASRAQLDRRRRAPEMLFVDKLSLVLGRLVVARRRRLRATRRAAPVRPRKAGVTLVGGDRTAPRTPRWPMSSTSLTQRAPPPSCAPSSSPPSPTASAARRAAPTSPPSAPTRSSRTSTGRSRSPRACRRRGHPPTARTTSPLVGPVGGARDRGRPASTRRRTAAQAPQQKLFDARGTSSTRGRSSARARRSWRGSPPRQRPRRTWRR